MTFKLLLLKLPSASSNSPLIILCRLPTPHHSECQEKKNVQLTPSMNLSSITSPDYGKEWPNFWFLEIQFNQPQAWTWSHLGASQCLWSNVSNSLLVPAGHFFSLDILNDEAWSQCNASHPPKWLSHPPKMLVTTFKWSRALDLFYKKFWKSTCFSINFGY